ncbi:hypothetical protein V496_03089 [Pseudogymnoascus sp. VKM F-4515 (FW-2607)]|nr:hypothetical protein V496_03089 [Pseudogymnoascus sp. VKM F-4515 (FW-2607)]KFY99543.1 hypothetical protein V498_00694 [Pseudogymnoascus sp. VKM F-4517 (FW-2822)]
MFISNPDVTAITATVTPFLNRDAVLHHIASRGFFSNNEGDTPIQRWSSLIGIISSIVGNILISFALNIQRYAHLRLHKELEEKKRRQRQVSNRYGTADGSWTGHNGRDETERLRGSFETAKSGSESGDDRNGNVEQQSYLKSPYWWVGIALMTIGETGNFLAYGFAPASIVSPLGVVALISNCVIAPILLKEEFRLRDFWGVVVSVLGAVTVVLSAEQEEKKLGPHEVIGAITTMEFEIYMAVTIGVMFILAWASPKYGSKTILIDLGLVALFGAYTVLSTKGVSSMLSTSFWEAFTNPITYALAVVLIGTAVMQVKYINRALQRFDSTQVIPVQFVLFTISVILGSAVLYRDFESTSPGRAVKFVGGCLLTFFGVFLITSGRVSHDDSSSDLESDDEAESISLANHDDRRASYYSDRNTRRASLNRARPSHERLINDEAAESDDDFLADDISRRSSRISYAHRSRPMSSSDYTTSQNLVPGSAPASHPLDSASLAALPSTSEATLDRPVRPAITRLISQNEYGQPQSDTAVLRPMTPARHSAGKPMIPGPFISPLSSSVVADTVRRSTDMYGSRRRPRLDLQATRSRERRDSMEGLLASEQNSPTKTSRVVDRHSYAEDGDVGRRSLEIPIEESGGNGRRRAQSLGQRLGGFFRNLGGTAPTTPEGEQDAEDLERLAREQD